jgi:hypothetical protein
MFSPFGPFCLFSPSSPFLVCKRITSGLFLYQKTGKRQTFHVHDEQSVNGLRKIAWASVFRSSFVSMSMSPCLNIHESMSPCLCLQVSMSLCPCLHFSRIPQQENETNRKQQLPFVSANGNGKLLFVGCTGKQKMDVCFPLSANDKW